MSSEVPSAPWHTQPVDAVAATLVTDARRGLQADVALARLERDGPNRIARRAGTPWWRRLGAQFVDPLVVILIGAAIVSGLLDEWIDAAVIAVVVIVNALIGFIQEHRAEGAIAALDAAARTEARVIRGGRRLRIPSQDLVVGDVVELAAGDHVPADLRLAEVHELRVEEASLTGESVPVDKALPPLPLDAVLGDQRNMAFAGTAVTHGAGLGLVVATGDRTQTGKIAGLLQQQVSLVTPLTRRITELSHLIVRAVLALSGLLFVLQWLRGVPAHEAFDAVVAMAVGAIPEGLPAAVTVLLAVGVSRMAARRALIRRLPAVETLGSTTVICSDKTGTLTQNRMTVTRYRVHGAEVDVTHGADAVSASLALDQHAALGLSLRCGALCTDAAARGDGGFDGDPTEVALVIAAHGLGADTVGYQRRALLPFASETPLMATLHDGPDGRRLWVKGAIEAVLPRCETQVDATGAAVPLEREQVLAEVARLASGGLRVLALAGRPAADQDRVALDSLGELQLYGLVGMIDPPRPAAFDAVAVCHRAGIQVKMITGDHAVTAAGIAAQIGLQGALDEHGSLVAKTGAELAALDESELSEVVESVAVFARVAPEQKLALVRALQARGHVVAMTGDGVNDAPALRHADIGVAMGEGGTDVARGAAAMVLTDDDFATIGAAVEEGRGVYENLRKFVAWTLPTNMGEAFVLIAAIGVGTELPILPVQILWINLVTALLLGVSLIFEPREPGLMERPPRSPDAPLLDRELIGRTVVVSAAMAAFAFALFVEAQQRGYTLEQARTLAIHTVVVVEVGYLFACRSLTLPLWRLGLFTNPWTLVGAGVVLLLQIGFTYAPIAHTLFHTAPLPVHHWLVATACGAVVYVLADLRKVVGMRAAPGSATPARG